MLTILDFTAAWCSPCKTLKPVLESVAHTRGVALEEVDVDRDPARAQAFLVKSMPTVVLLRDGREVGRFVGTRNRAFVDGVVTRALAGDTAIAAP